MSSKFDGSSWSTNFSAGARAERQVKNNLVAATWVVFRPGLLWGDTRGILGEAEPGPDCFRVSGGEGLPSSAFEGLRRCPYYVGRETWLPLPYAPSVLASLPSREAGNHRPSHFGSNSESRAFG